MSQRLSTRIYSLFPVAKLDFPSPSSPSRMEMMMEAEVGILACHTWVYDQALTASIRTLYLSLKTKHGVHLHPSYISTVSNCWTQKCVLTSWLHRATCSFNLLPHYNSTFSYFLHASLFFHRGGSLH